MDYFPVFMDLRERLCVLIGGGDVAARKAALLLRAGARLRVVAPVLGDALSELASGAQVTHVARELELSDLDGAALVVSATDQRAINRAVSERAMALNIPVNVVDNPELCSVIVPAIVDRSPILIAVGTGGSAPVLARLLRANIEANVPVGYGELAALSASLRAEVQRSLPDMLARRRFWEEVFEGEIAELSMRGEGAQAEQLLRDKLASAQQPAADGGSTGEVYLIGAGPNDPDLVSFRAVRLLQRCDLVLCAPDLAESVADLSRRDATRLRLNSWPPELADMTRRLASAVHGGMRACVLAPHDAFRSEVGRAVEAAVRAAQLPCLIVPGIA